MRKVSQLLVLFVICRLEMAATKYFELLTSTNDCTRDYLSSCSKITLPVVSVMFEEAIHVQLQAKFFLQALKLCETYLVKLDWTAGDREPGFESHNSRFNTTVDIRETSSLKRSHFSYVPHLTDCSLERRDSDNIITAKIALYKTEALLQLGRHHEASAFIERLMKLLFVKL